MGTNRIPFNYFNTDKVLMSLFKEFFNARTLINGLVFSIPASALILWRITFLYHLSYFSAEAGQIFLFFVALCYLLFLFLFFILFWLSRRKQDY